jgi:N-sulfoglucosamine sulfohydrolase
LKKNILFLIADDWSPIAGCYGNPVIQTPVVDSLAKQGTIFTQAFCTSPSCAPSRATIHTGLHSHTHGQYGLCNGESTFRTRPESPTLPSILRDHGVFTGIFSKQHTWPPEHYPWDFNRSEHWKDHKQHFDPEDLYTRAKEFFELANGKPFYLHVGFHTPHRREPGYNNQHSFKKYTNISYDPASIAVPDFLPDCPEVREDLAEYYTAISRHDFSIGRVMDALRESGRLDETLIIITSDHGMPFPGAKASSFDTGHHCPLIVVDPGAKKRGHTNNALINWTNFMPTMLDWFGIQIPEHLQGRSFLPILEEGQPTGWDETTFSHTFHEVTMCYPYRVIRNRKYKYVLNLHPELTHPLASDIIKSPTWKAIEAGRLEMGKRRTVDFLHQDEEKLYDIENDPMETTNLLNTPELAGILADFRSRMNEFRKKTQDPWLKVTNQRRLKAWV